MITASSLGFRSAALTFLNQRAVVVALVLRLDADVGMEFRKGRGAITKSRAVARFARIS
jgi:hypothetical protein